MRWRCRLPREHGQHIAGPWGPLARMPGSAVCWDGTLTLDEDAFTRLAWLGSRDGAPDGRITFTAGVPVLHAGGGCYEVTRCLDEEVLTARMARYRWAALLAGSRFSG